MKRKFLTKSTAIGMTLAMTAGLCACQGTADSGKAKETADEGQ